MTVTGPTKYFFEDENVDRLFAMTMTLGAEISALGDKLDTVIRLLEAQNPVSAAAVRDYAPGDEVQAERDAARARFVGNLLAPLALAADQLAAQVAGDAG